MRQTGRTTRMLLKLALYISENWDKHQHVIVVAHNEMFADTLQKRLTDILPGFSKQQRGLILYGNTVIAFMGRDRYNRPERRPLYEKRTFIDHYQGGD